MTKLNGQPASIVKDFRKKLIGWKIMLSWVSTQNKIKIEKKNIRKRKISKKTIFKLFFLKKTIFIKNKIKIGIMDPKNNNCIPVPIADKIDNLSIV